MESLVPQTAMQQLAHIHTGETPFAYLQIIAEWRQLPERIDPVLIVVPDTWGKAS